jgi:DNA-binding transcriptional regulator YiaG
MGDVDVEMISSPLFAGAKILSAAQRRREVAKLETVIREAIARGARRQVRVLVLPVRREVLRLRRRVGELQDTLTTLRRSAAGWRRLMEAAPRIPPVSEEEAKAARLSPRLVQSLRKRLDLSQMALARLAGVSASAVAHWEAGESTPTGQNRVTLVALRKMGKREVKELLARQVKETASRASHGRKRRPKRPRRGAVHRRRGVSRE